MIAQYLLNLDSEYEMKTDKKTPKKQQQHPALLFHQCLYWTPQGFLRYHDRALSLRQYQLGDTLLAECETVPVLIKLRAQPPDSVSTGTST
ncbi:uncharacterized protein V6R79_009587 [Siganus canaliculatus]